MPSRSAILGVPRNAMADRGPVRRYRKDNALC